MGEKITCLSCKLLNSERCPEGRKGEYATIQSLFLARNSCSKSETFLTPMPGIVLNEKTLERLREIAASCKRFKP